MEELRQARVLNVYDEVHGAELAVDTPSGSTTLQLAAEPWAFDELGGFCAVHHNDKLPYDTIDDDAMTIHLTQPTPADYGAGAFVAVWPKAVTRWAEIAWADEDDGETAVVRVPHHLKAFILPGARLHDRQEPVIIELVIDEYAIKDVLGIRPRLGHEHAPPERVFRYTVESNIDGYVGESSRTNPETHYPGTAVGFRMIATTAPTSDAIFTLYVSTSAYPGTLVATATIPAGLLDSGVVNISQAFDEHDAFRIEQTSPQDSGVDIFGYVYVTLDLDRV